jgi:broad specificity phosphatase PhoE
VSRIVIVRHAQASFLAPDYDRLSPTGETQARLLGDYWARRNIDFDGVYSGPRERHRHTATIVAESYRSAQHDLPKTVELEEFDEFDGELVLRKSLPHLLDTNHTIRELHEVFVASDGMNERRKNFQRLFEIVIGKWVDGELAVSGAESWLEFCARVNRGLSRVMSDGRSSAHFAIFSSGGPIAVAMQRALNLSPQDTLRVAWMPRNCSYSEFVFSDDRFTLSTFNAFPHLDDAALLTYR